MLEVLLKPWLYPGGSGRVVLRCVPCARGRLGELVGLGSWAGAVRFGESLWKCPARWSRCGAGSALLDLYGAREHVPGAEHCRKEGWVPGLSGF